MSDPRRLLDDAAEDRSMRDDLRQVADAPPPALDYDAGLRALGEKIRPGAPPASGAGAKIALVLLAIGAGVALLAWLSTPPPPEPAPPAAPAIPPPSEPAPEPQPVVEPGAPIEAAPPTPEPEIAPPRALRRETPDDRLRREMQQIAEARSALDREPARALALVEAGRREFGEGVFGEERAAIRVLALDALGRDAEAQRLGAAFLARHPTGLFTERVRRALER